MLCRFIALLAQSFCMRWPHSTHAHSMASTPPLTRTRKSSLFMHVHSSPLCLAARLHRCHAKCSHYINNGLSFSRQTSYIGGETKKKRSNYPKSKGSSNLLGKRVGYDWDGWMQGFWAMDYYLTCVYKNLLNSTFIYHTLCQMYVIFHNKRL